MGGQSRLRNVLLYVGPARSIGAELKNTDLVSYPYSVYIISSIWSYLK